MSITATARLECGSLPEREIGVLIFGLALYRIQPSVVGMGLLLKECESDGHCPTGVTAHGGPRRAFAV